jgi:hypothetical protein
MQMSMPLDGYIAGPNVRMRILWVTVGTYGLYLLVIGFLLFLPGLLHPSRLLRDPQGPFRWRDMLRRREDSGG